MGFWSKRLNFLPFNWLSTKVVEKSVENFLGDGLSLVKSSLILDCPIFWHFVKFIFYQMFAMKSKLSSAVGDVKWNGIFWAVGQCG